MPEKIPISLYNSDLFLKEEFARVNQEIIDLENAQESLSIKSTLSYVQNQNKVRVARLSAGNALGDAKRIFATYSGGFALPKQNTTQRSSTYSPLPVQTQSLSPLQNKVLQSLLGRGLRTKVFRRGEAFGDAGGGFLNSYKSLIGNTFNAKTKQGVVKGLYPMLAPQSQAFGSTYRADNRSYFQAQLHSGKTGLEKEGLSEERGVSSLKSLPTIERTSGKEHCVSTVLRETPSNPLLAFDEVTIFEKELPRSRFKSKNERSHTANQKGSCKTKFCKQTRKNFGGTKNEVFSKQRSSKASLCSSSPNTNSLFKVDFYLSCSKILSNTLNKRIRSGVSREFLFVAINLILFGVLAVIQRSNYGKGAIFTSDTQLHHDFSLEGRAKFRFCTTPSIANIFGGCDDSKKSTLCLQNFVFCQDIEQATEWAGQRGLLLRPSLAEIEHTSDFTNQSFVQNLSYVQSQYSPEHKGEALAKRSFVRKIKSSIEMRKKARANSWQYLNIIRPEYLHRKFFLRINANTKQLFDFSKNSNQRKSNSEDFKNSFARYLFSDQDSIDTSFEKLFAKLGLVSSSTNAPLSVTSTFYSCLPSCDKYFINTNIKTVHVPWEDQKQKRFIGIFLEKSDANSKKSNNFLELKTRPWHIIKAVTPNNKIIAIRFLGRSKSDLDAEKTKRLFFYNKTNSVKSKGFASPLKSLATHSEGFACKTSFCTRSFAQPSFCMPLASRKDQKGGKDDKHISRFQYYLPFYVSKKRIFTESDTIPSKRGTIHYKPNYKTELGEQSLQKTMFFEDALLAGMSSSQQEYVRSRGHREARLTKSTEIFTVSQAVLKRCFYKYGVLLLCLTRPSPCTLQTLTNPKGVFSKSLLTKNFVFCNAEDDTSFFVPPKGCKPFEFACKTKFCTTPLKNEVFAALIPKKGSNSLVLPYKESNKNEFLKPQLFESCSSDKTKFNPSSFDAKANQNVCRHRHVLDLIPTFNYISDNKVINISVSGYQFPELDKKEITYLFRKNAVIDFYFTRPYRHANNQPIFKNERYTSLRKSVPYQDLAFTKLTKNFVFCKQPLQNEVLHEFAKRKAQDTNFVRHESTPLKQPRLFVFPTSNSFFKDLQMQYTQVNLDEISESKALFEKMGRDYEDYLRQPKDSLPALIISPSLEDDREIEEEGIRIFNKRDFIKNQSLKHPESINAPQGFTDESLFSREANIQKQLRVVQQDRQSESPAFDKPLKGVANPNGMQNEVLQATRFTNQSNPSANPYKPFANPCKPEGFAKGLHGMQNEVLHAKGLYSAGGPFGGQVDNTSSLSAISPELQEKEFSFVKSKNDFEQKQNGEQDFEAFKSQNSFHGKSASTFHQNRVANALRQAEEEIDNIAKREEKAIEKNKQAIPPLTRLEALYTIRNQEKKHEQAKDFTSCKSLRNSIKSLREGVKGKPFSENVIEGSTGRHLNLNLKGSKKEQTIGSLKSSSLPIFDELFLYSEEDKLFKNSYDYSKTRRSIFNSNQSNSTWIFSNLGDENLCTDRKHSFFGEVSLLSKKLTAKEQKQLFQQKADPLFKNKAETYLSWEISDSIKANQNNLFSVSISQSLKKRAPLFKAPAKFNLERVNDLKLSLLSSGLSAQGIGSIQSLQHASTGLKRTDNIASARGDGGGKSSTAVLKEKPSFLQAHTDDVYSIAATVPLSLLSQLSVHSKANKKNNETAKFQVGTVNTTGTTFLTRPILIKSPQSIFGSLNRIYFHNNLSQNKACQASTPKIKDTPLESPVSHRVWQAKRIEPSTFRMHSRNKSTSVIPRISQKDWRNIMEWQLKKHFFEEDKRLLPLYSTISPQPESQTKPKLGALAEFSTGMPNKKLKIKKVNLYLPWISIKKREDAINNQTIRLSSNPQKSKSIEWPLTRLDLTEREIKGSYLSTPSKDNFQRLTRKEQARLCETSFCIPCKPFANPSGLHGMQNEVLHAKGLHGFAKTYLTPRLYSNVHPIAKAEDLINALRLPTSREVTTFSTKMQLYSCCSNTEFGHKIANYWRLPIQQNFLTCKNHNYQTPFEDASLLTKNEVFYKQKHKPMSSSRKTGGQMFIAHEWKSEQNFVLLQSILFESVTKYSWLFIYTLFFGLMFKQLFKFIYKVGLRNFFIKFLHSDFGRAVTSEEFRHSIQNPPLSEIYMPKKRLSELLGLGRNKAQLLEIVWFLRNNCIGRNGPRGILLVGPPGVENVSVVQAIAGEAAVPIIIQSLEKIAADNEPQRQLEQLYTRAQKQAPCILFLDQLDNIGTRRDQLFTDNKRGHNWSSSTSTGVDKSIYTQENSSVNSNKETGNKLNIVLRLLTILDGINQSTGVVTVATARNITKLDPALLRPKRFDRRIYLSLPNQQDRAQLFKVQTQSIGHIQEMPWDYLSLRTESMSAADIRSAINYSLFRAVQQKSIHTVETLEYGIDCVKTLTDKRLQKIK